jgi:hypothetical protein
VTLWKQLPPVIKGAATLFALLTATIGAALGAQAHLAKYATDEDVKAVWQAQTLIGEQMQTARYEDARRDAELKATREIAVEGREAIKKLLDYMLVNPPKRSR